MRKRNNGKKTLLLMFCVFVMSIIILVVDTYMKDFTLSKQGDTSETIKTSHTQVCKSKHKLPVVVIDTNSQDIEYLAENRSKKQTPRYEVDFSLYDVHSQGHTCIGENIEPVVQETLRISLRGQSSLTSPKKQFSLKFLDEAGEEKDVSLLGMPEENEWVLNGMSADSSLIRNYLAYHVSGEIMDFAPETKFVEVYVLDDQSSELNDESYRGIYMLIEKITRSSDRVDITKADERYADTSFIIARDKIKEGDQVVGSLWGNVLTENIIGADGITRARSTLTYVYPGKTKMTEKQKKIIDNYINNFELGLYSYDFKDEENGYRKYIDVLSFVDYAIINEFFNNVDGGDVSTYYYRDIGGLLHAGPVWDFDLTLGLPKGSSFSQVEGFRMFNTIWFEQLFRDPYFVDMYITRYEFLRKNVLSEEHLFALIDDAAAELGDAIERNNSKWADVMTQTISHEEEIQQIKDYIIKRANWIDQNTSLLYRN